MIRLGLMTLLLLCGGTDAFSEATFPLEEVRDRWYVGFPGFQRALSLQREYQLPMFVEVNTPYCAICKIVWREFLSTSNFAEATPCLLKVRLDATAGDRSRRLAERWGVRSYPGYLLFERTEAPPQPIQLVLGRGEGGLVLRELKDLVEELGLQDVCGGGGVEVGSGEGCGSSAVGVGGSMIGEVGCSV